VIEQTGIPDLKSENKDAKASMTDRDDPDLTGSQKAAVLLMAMGEKRSGRLQLGMDKDEVEELHAARKSLGQIPSEVVEKIIDEYDGKRAAMPMNQPQNRDIKLQQEQAAQRPAAKKATRQQPAAAPPKPASDAAGDGTAAPVHHLTNIEV
jgi:hypothetical protein